MDFKKYIKDKCDADVQVFTSLDDAAFEFIVTILTPNGVTYTRKLPTNRTDKYHLEQLGNELIDFIRLLDEYQEGLHNVHKGTLAIEKAERSFPHVVTAYRNRKTDDS